MNDEMLARIAGLLAEAKADLKRAKAAIDKDTAYGKVAAYKEVIRLEIARRKAVVDNAYAAAAVAKGVDNVAAATTKWEQALEAFLTAQGATKVEVGTVA